MLPQPNDPNAGPDQYTGGLATTSSYMQLDDLGCPLFFAVNGDLYDGKGYRIMAGGDLGCGFTPGCLLPGSSELVVAPVPGRCGQWYLFHTMSVTGSSADPVLHVSVLDMTMQNPRFPGDPERRGRVLNDTDLDSEGYDLVQNWPIVSDIAVDLGSPFNDQWAANERCLHMDAVRCEAEDRTFLFASNGEVLARYELTPSGVVLRGSQPVDLAGAVLNPSLRPRTAKGELEAVAVGSTIRVAMSVTLFSDQTLPPPPDYNAFLVHVAAYDASLPNVPRTFYENVPIGDLLINEPAPPTNLGTTVTYPGAGGIEFASNGELVYWCRSLADHGQQFWDGLHHLGTFDWTTLTVSSFPSIGLLPSVDTELELGPAPDGLGEALYLAGTDAQGNAWLSALVGPDDPNTATWLPQAITLDDASLCADPSLAWNNGQDRYHLLQAQGHADASLDLMTDVSCCAERQAMTCTVAFSANTGQSNWTTSDNPFCDKPIVRICQELRIPTGAHITAQDLTFAFSADAALVIEPGASFTCTNCTFTSACPEEQWKGIEVHGTITQHQFGGSHPTYQGELVLHDSRLYNAVDGILTAERIGGGINGFRSGGVVVCANTSFRNCRTALRYLPYQGTQPGTGLAVRNRGRFTGCSFSIDANYPVALDFRHHASLWQVDGLLFSGCTFTNARSTETNSHERGYGIYSLDAHYEVRERCNVLVPLGQECPAGSYSPSTFAGLDHGIHALTSLTSRAFVVDRAAFTANVCGVYASGVVGYRVTRSDFELGNSVVTDLTNFPLEENWEQYHRGIFSTESYGMLVEDNTLTQAGPYVQTEGIVIGYTRDHNDKVRRNTASGLEVGFIGEGICADAYNYLTNTIGLQYLCNTNDGNAYNFWDRQVTSDLLHSQEHTMRTNQGTMTAPAANVFDQTCADPEGDYKRTSPNGVLRYIFGTTLRAEPLCYTTDPTSPVAVQQAASELAVPCPPRNYRPRGVRSLTEADEAKTALLTELFAYGTTRYLYDQLLDGGSTDDVVDEIMATWPSDAWELRDYLLAKSPFLSVTALQEMVLRNVMPTAMVAEVLIANPEATHQSGFIEWMQVESGYPLPEFLLASVVASWDETTYRYSLESQMGVHHAALTHHAHIVLDHWRNDTLYEHVDSLRWTWQQVRTPAARYAEALTYIQQGNTTAAKDAVEELTDGHMLHEAALAERQRMLDLITFCAGVFGDDRSMAQLTTTEQDQLEALVDGAYDRPATWAQNLLCFGYDRCRTPLTGGGNEPRSMVLAQLPDEVTIARTRLEAAPNPANAWVAFNVRLTTVPVNGHLVVRDVMGRSVWQGTVGSAEQQLLWDCRGVEAGSYTAELVNAGAIVATTKLITQR